MNGLHRDRDRPAIGGTLIFGLVLVGLGVFFLLDRFGVVEIDVPWGWWPLILVAIGVGKLLDGAGRRDAQGGAWLIIIGFWLILNFEGYFGFEWRNSWPLLLIAGGAMIVWKALAGGEDYRCAPGEKSERIEQLERVGGGDER